MQFRKTVTALLFSALSISSWATTLPPTDSPFLQRTPPKGFFINDLSWSSSQVNDFMNWERAGKLGNEQSIFFGGKLAIDAQWWQPDNGIQTVNGNNVNGASTIFLQNARIMTAGKISEDVSFAYGYGFVSRNTLFGFATLDPKSTNWYLAAGHMVLPFAYLNGAGAPYTFEIILAAYQVKDDAVLLGYKTDKLRLSGSIFRADARLQAVPNDRVFRSLNNFIVDGEYDILLPSDVKLTVGGSYLNDIRGITSTSVGNLWTSTNNDPQIGAYNARAFINYKNIKLTGEIINHVRSSSLTDNGKAGMQALSLTYNDLKAFNLSHKLMLSYNHTNKMSQVPLTLGGFTTKPAAVKTQWLAAVSTYIYKNTKLSVEGFLSRTYNDKNFIGSTIDLSVYF